MERKIISLPCGARVGGDSFVQVMAAEVSGIKSNLKLEMEVMNLHSRALVALDYEVVFYNSILEKLNNDKTINGILLQSPIPSNLDINEAFRTISPEKDVDGFNPINVGKLVLNQDTFVSCTPYGIMKMFEEYNLSL